MLEVSVNQMEVAIYRNEEYGTKMRFFLTKNKTGIFRSYQYLYSYKKNSGLTNSLDGVKML